MCDRDPLADLAAQQTNVMDRPLSGKVLPLDPSERIIGSTTLRHDHDDKSFNAKADFKIRLAVMVLACVFLAFLVSVDHERWFKLRPASGTAAAMFYASNPANASGSGDKEVIAPPVR